MSSQVPRSDTKPLLIGLVAILAILAFYTFRAFSSPESDNPTPVETLDTKLPDVPSVSASDLLKESLPASYILIDVRSEDAFLGEHIVGSVNKSFEVIMTSPLPQASDSKQRIILVGSVDDQNLAEQATRLLISNGLKTAFMLDGGIEGWKSQGGRTISQGNPDSFVDQSKVLLIESKELQSALLASSPVQVVDMRPADVFAQGHIPKSINIPLEELETRYSEIPSGKQIVTYGNSALEDFQAGVRLFDLHFLGAQVLKGGYNAWKNAGFPTETSSN